MKIRIIINDNETVLHDSSYSTDCNLTAIRLEKPFEVDGWVVKSLSLYVNREKVE